MGYLLKGSNGTAASVAAATGAATDPNQPLYRMSPSPPNGSSYHGYHSGPTSPSHERGHHQGPYADLTHRGGPSYHGGPSTSSYGGPHGHYHHPANNHHHSHYGSDSRSSGSSSSYCACRTTPAAGQSLVALSHQVQNTLHSLRQYTHHPADTRCDLYNRLVGLNSTLQ
jgi:hypothetical protein